MNEGEEDEEGKVEKVGGGRQKRKETNPSKTNTDTQPH